MPLSDEFVSAIDTAVEKLAIENKQEENKPGDVKIEETGTAADDRGDIVENKDTPADGGGDDEPKPSGEADSGSEDAGSIAAPAGAPTISDYALTRAVQAGLSLEDARYFPSDDSLLRVVEGVEAAKQVATKTTEIQEEDPFAALPKLDPEAYEPEVIKTFDALTEIVKKQHETIKGLQAHQEQSAQSTYQATAREIEDWFNGQVKKLGDDFHDTLGAGDYGSLARGSAELAKRDQIAQHMAIQIAGYQASGHPMPAREQIFDAAVRVVLGDDLQKIREGKLSRDLEKRSSQHIARAGGKKASPAGTGDVLGEVAAMLDSKFFAKGR